MWLSSEYFYVLKVDEIFTNFLLLIDGKHKKKSLETIAIKGQRKKSEVTLDEFILDSFA